MLPLKSFVSAPDDQSISLCTFINHKAAASQLDGEKKSGKERDHVLLFQNYIWTKNVK